MPQFTPYANESQAAFNRRMASAQRNPGQEWLDKLRDGGRVVGSPQLLEATGRFTERLGAPRPPRSGMAPSQSDLPGSRPSLMSAISSLRPDPSDTGTDPRNPRSFSPNPLVRGGYEAVPSPAELDAAQVESQVGSEGSERARSDVSDKTSGIGAYFGAPGMGTAMIGAGGAMMEAAGQSGANFGGSLGTGLKEFAAQRAKFGESEIARRKLTETAEARLAEDGREAAGWASTVRSIGTQSGVDPALLERYVEMASSQSGFDYVMRQIAPELVEPPAETAVMRNLAEMQAARDKVQRLEAAGVPEGDPEMIRARQVVDDWENSPGVVRQGPAPTTETANLKEWREFVRLQQEADPDYVGTAAGYRAFLAGTPSQYGDRTPTGAQIASEKTRVAAYDDYYAFDGGKARFGKNLDTFAEVMSDLDVRIAADGEYEDSTNWENDGNGGFYQAMKGALVQRMPFLGSALEAADTNTLDLVRAVVFQSLKETLGGQFAEREATALVQAAYNPMLPPAVNRRRIGRLMNELRSTDHYMESMADYYHREKELAFYTHENAEDMWDLAVQTGEIAGLGSAIINPLDYTNLSGDELETVMQGDLDNLTPRQRVALAFKVSGGGMASPNQISPTASALLDLIRKMGR